MTAQAEDLLKDWSLQNMAPMLTVLPLELLSAAVIFEIAYLVTDAAASASRWPGAITRPTPSQACIARRERPR